MCAAISTSGRVCLCEWTGPVTVTMMVALLSVVRRLRATEEKPLLLLLRVNVPAAKSLAHNGSSFLSILPALFDFCHEVAIICDDNEAIGAIRRVLTAAGTPLLPALHKPVGFFDLLDEAFTYNLDSFPHEILELPRRRIRSGAWLTAETTGTFDETCSRHGDYGGPNLAMKSASRVRSGHSELAAIAPALSSFATVIAKMR